MNESARQDDSDSRLWRRYVASAPGRQIRPIIQANLLAAYLEGTASQEQMEQIEEQMASSAEFLEEIVQLRQMLAAPASPAAKRAVDNAKALVPAEVVLFKPFQAAQYNWWHKAQWSAVAAAVVLASLAGYSFGRDAWRSQLQVDLSAAAEVSHLTDDMIEEPFLEIFEKPGQPNGGVR